jgi:LAO/AO transport system kinase
VLGKTARYRGQSVGILAVDPSSPRSGGALLGDRARMEIDPDDSRLYMRSMASGGDLGGLARAAGAAIDVLSAAYDLVLTETTGVGQSETDIEHVADTVVMVIQPGSGDVLQFLKAGIIEIPDLFVVNKADLGSIAQRAVADLGAALNAVHAGASGEPPRVVATSVSAMSGVEELLDAIENHKQKLDASGERLLRRRRAAAQWALRLCTQRFGEYGVDRAGGRAALRDRLFKAIEAGATAVEAVAAARVVCIGA